MISTLVLAILGVILTLLLLFLAVRKLEAAIIWGILLGPSLGSSVGGFLINAFAGDIVKAVESFKFLPFFLAPIDEAFFGLPANGLLMAMGSVILGLWVYVLLHFLSGKFGIWSLPIFPSLLWVAGMTLPNIRLRLAEALPAVSFLTEPLYGLLGLLILSASLGFVCYLYYRRTSMHELEVPLPFKG